MARTKTSFVCACAAISFAATAALVAGSRGTAEASLPIATVAAAASQTIEGFGASGAWWPGDVFQFSPAARAAVSTLLFTPQGLDLSIYRYNIGAGGVGNPDRPSPTFLGRSGRFDWSRDPGGMYFLEAARSLGVPTLVGFANSAPGVWTTSKRSCGGSLVPGDEAPYASYLAAVAQHVHDANGISLSYVSPMNEPDGSVQSCAQEGMSVPVSRRADVVLALARALASHAPWAHVIADESSHVGGQFLSHAPGWLSSPGVSQAVDVLAHHDYDYPADHTLGQVASLGSQYAKRTWMSEVCCYHGGFGPGYDPSMASGMWVARSIWSSLTVAHDTAWAWWTALSPELGCDPSAHPSCPAAPNRQGWDDGLLYFDRNFRHDHNQRVWATKRFWVLATISRFVRPGAVLHEVSGVPAPLEVMAFQTAQGWVVVEINTATSGSPEAVSLQLPPGQGPVSSLLAFRTSATENVAPVPPPLPADDGTWTLTAPSQSVTTYLIGTSSG